MNEFHGMKLVDVLQALGFQVPSKPKTTDSLDINSRKRTSTHQVSEMIRREKLRKATATDETATPQPAPDTEPTQTQPA